MFLPYEKVKFFPTLLYSTLLVGTAYGQCPANLRLELVNTSTECNEYALYLKDAPTISLYRLSASLFFSQNTAGTVQAQLGASLAAAGGYTFSVNNNGAPRVNINRIGSGGSQPPFTLPPSPNNELLLFTFSFAGPPGATVTAYIGSDPMIFLNTGQFPGTICSIGISNQMANPVSCTLDPGSNITGRIIRDEIACIGASNSGIPNVQVTVSSTSFPAQGACVDYTGNSGQYNCLVLPNEDYSIVPYVGNINPACGLGNEDIQRINTHILGANLFTLPREYIGADFNFSNSITNIDMVSIQKAILFNQVSPQFRSWRFVSNYDQLTVVPSFNWSSFLESIQLTNVPSGSLPLGTSTEFTAIKIGDIKLSCFECLNPLEAESSQTPFVLLNVQLEKVAFSLVELILTPASDIQSQTVHGLEFQLAPDYLELLEVSGSGKFTLSEENHVTDKANNYFRAIWLPFEAGQSDQKAQLRIKARLLKPFQTPEQLINMMENSQYFQDDQEIRWKFNFPNEQNRGYFYPNPFHDQLEFTAPNAASTLRVLDSRGAVIWQSDLLPGQRMDIPTADWPTGAYFYHCIANEHSHSGKLIKQ